MTASAHEAPPRQEPRIQTEPWGEMTWLVEHGPEGPDPGLSLAVMTVKPGHPTPWHRHANCTEALYVTGGRMRIHRGDEAFDCAPGDSVFIPKGCPHAARNLGDTEAVAVIAYSAGRRDYQPLAPDDEPLARIARSPSRWVG